MTKESWKEQARLLMAAREKINAEPDLAWLTQNTDLLVARMAFVAESLLKETNDALLDTRSTREALAYGSKDFAEAVERVASLPSATRSEAAKELSKMTSVLLDRFEGHLDDARESGAKDVRVLLRKTKEEGLTEKEGGLPLTADEAFSEALASGEELARGARFEESVSEGLALLSKQSGEIDDQKSEMGSEAASESGDLWLPLKAALFLGALPVPFLFLSGKENQPPVASEVQPTESAGQLPLETLTTSMDQSLTGMMNVMTPMFFIIGVIMAIKGLFHIKKGMETGEGLAQGVVTLGMSAMMMASPTIMKTLMATLQI